MERKIHTQAFIESAHPVAEARAAIARAQAVLDRRPAPTPQHDRAAKFTAELAERILGRVEPFTGSPGRVTVPDVRWEPGLRERGQRGYVWIGATKAINLASDLSLAETVETTLHESVHLGQWVTELKDHTEHAERRAREFSARWTDAVLRAGLGMDWDVSQVHVADDRSGVSFRRGDGGIEVVQGRR